eukprot:7377672-Prymnesium_polylepis.2
MLSDGEQWKLLNEEPKCMPSQRAPGQLEDRSTGCRKCMLSWKRLARSACFSTYAQIFARLSWPKLSGYPPVERKNESASRGMLPTNTTGVVVWDARQSRRSR